MFLKRLETVGFKSFAERIGVDFVPGVTAVVGPNGSGKSNIIDAVRWVLGEQSAKSLRGSKMEDIIFQGSENRKALNVAEVTLVLDNGDKRLPLDYDEVSVTRRVYRSGDSEFYINKQSCRLKDIVDLFMDSGLGREAFSIISQGKVEEILSSKAEERRIIFEEAAGVLKYKQRKKKAEYKLAETQENLNRVEDIIYEIEQQINPLQEQAETAKEYLKQKELLKEQEISLLITEIEQLHEQWKQLKVELDKEKMAEIEQKTNMQQKEAVLEQERQEIQKLDEFIEQLQANLLSTTEQLEKYEGKKQVFHERTKHYSENKEKLEKQREEAAKKIKILELELRKEEEHLEELQQSKQNIKEQVQKFKEKMMMDGEHIAEKIEELKTDYIEYLNEQAAKRNEKQSIEQQLKQLTTKHDKQSDKFQDYIATREELEAQYRQIQEKLQSAEEKNNKDEALLKKNKTELEADRKSFQELQTKLYQGYRHIEKLKSKKEMLEEMKEDFQGFFQGVKAILKAREKNHLNQIHGAVIELIDVPKQYITAIETVLGGQAQHIVTENDTAARKAIAWLKQTSSGRATFLPLESIQARSIPSHLIEKMEAHDGFIGIAANLISVDSIYQKAVDHLMGHVVVSRNLKDANEIAKLGLNRYRVVTLEGDVVNPGGSMSGGAQKKTNQSLFTREKDLQEVSEKLEIFQAKTIEFEKRVNAAKKNIATKEQEIARLEQAISDNHRSIQEIKTHERETEMQVASVSQHLALYDQEEKQYKHEVSELKERDRLLVGELQQIEHMLTTIQNNIDTLSEQESEFRENREQLQQDYHQSQVSLAEQEIRVKNQQEKTKALHKQRSELQEQYQTYTTELTELVEINESADTEENIDASIENAKKQKEELLQTIQQQRLSRSERTQAIQDHDRELKEENRAHQELVQMIQQKEVQITRLDVELENRLSLLQTEYTITYEKAKQTYEKVVNIEDAKIAVEQIKRSIDRLGTVNLGAIDEYDRISERYAFLNEQKNDLVEAKQTLFAVIAEMDDEMKKLFDQTFTKIKEEFSIVFQELFGGGRAELKLTDPANLLETGVDIIAQPPGKKLQQLGLLSGGERALTAIALLFSILRVRPVPFCILDEVEAALDEANVSRFAKYVKMYSENTQFIVITHRKGTMEEADVLYGVTMQESGVSRMVSVRLEETKELIES